jgi:hypothetical protein
MYSKPTAVKVETTKKEKKTRTKEEPINGMNPLLA